MADIKKLHQRIELALEEQEYQEALSLARRAVDEDPEDGIGWYYLLLADNGTNDPETLLNGQRDWRRQKAYQQAVAHGGHADILRQLGSEWAYRQAVALQQQKKYESAMVYFKEIGDYKDSARRAGECQGIIEKALAEQKRLEAELEVREAQVRKAQEAANRKAGEVPRRGAADKHTPYITQKQAVPGSGRKRIVSKPADVSRLESAAHLCEEYISLPYGNWAETEAKEMLGICRSLARRAKWGDCLDDVRAYQELAEYSSFWQVYGAEQNVGELAGKLYDVETGAPEGLPWDDKLACYWAGIAASMGDKGGCLQMGRLYECGAAVDPNFKLAAHFYNAAESRSEQIYFARLSEAARQIGGNQNEIDELENISSPPNFNMSPTAIRVGSYWKFHKQAELAKLRLDKKTAERMQQLLAPQQEVFSAVDSKIKWLARKDDPGFFKAFLAAILPCAFWTYFVFHMGDYIEEVDLLFSLIGIFTLPVVYVAVVVGFSWLFEKLQWHRIRRQAKRWRRSIAAIRQAHDRAVRECHKPDCPEYREFQQWTAKTKEMGRALRVTADGWQHAYLMYYGAGIYGAETPDDADRYAGHAAKRGRRANLSYVPAPFIRWMLQEISDKRKPVDLLELAEKYGRDCRRQYNTGEGWKAVFALECILFHAKFWLKADLKTTAAFWRTNPKMLRELAGIYRKGSKELGQNADPSVGMVLTDFAAEIYIDRYRSGQLSALADLVVLYQEADNVYEAGRWARLACEKRCPQFAKYAFRYYRYFDEKERAEMDRYVSELVYSLDFRSKERKEVLELRDKINELKSQESKARENAQKVAQLQQSLAQSQAREAVEQELDRRERGLNMLFGDGYMTNEELYLTGRQSVSDYVNNDIYRSFRRSELEKKQREQEM